MGSHSVTCHPHPAWHYVLWTGLTAHRRWGEVCCLRLRRCVVVRCSTTSWVVVARQSVMQSVAVADCCRRQPAVRPTISAPGISLSPPLSVCVCVCLFVAYCSWAYLRPQSSASVLERLPSSVLRKDQCSVVSDPIQWLRATCGWVGEIFQYCVCLYSMLLSCCLLA